MSEKENCIFCKFIKGEINPVKIYEDEKYLAILDINPMHPGHTLLIPKKHIDYVFDINDKEFCELFLLSKKISFALKKAMNTEKVGMVVEGFLVRHVHLHLIPINKGMPVDPCLQKPIEIDKLQEIANKIKKELQKSG
jgi:histidine triad (HIT) family protein